MDRLTLIIVIVFSALLVSCDRHSMHNSANEPISISIHLTSQSLKLPKGLSSSLSVIALYKDLSTRDVTDDVQFKMSRNDLLSFSDKNKVMGLNSGFVNIIASLPSSSGTFLTSSLMLEVTDAVVLAIQVTSTSNMLSVGLTENFIATAQMSDGSTRDITNDPAVSWQTSNSAIATISSGQGSNNGVTTGASVGSVTITASGFGVKGSTSLNITPAVPVGLQVTPTNRAIAVGLTQQFIATALMSDGSTRDITNDPSVSWSSSNNTFATISTNQISGNGVATGISAGTVNMTASGFGVTGSASLQITTAVPVGLQVTPAISTIAVNLTQSLIATVQMSDGSTHDVTNNPALSWSSSNNAVATISSSQSSGNGVATGISAGTVTITASVFGVTGFASLEITTAVPIGLQITPASTAIAINLNKSFIATVLMSDGTTHDVTNNPAVSWSSSDSTIATISSSQNFTNGVATGVNAGTVTISASGFGFTGSASLEITTAVPIALQVTPASSVLAVKLTQRFIATILMSDGSTHDVTNNPALSWRSSNKVLANITSSQGAGNGIATGVNAGTVTIVASGFGLTGSASLEITTASPIELQVTPANSKLAVSLTQRFIATILMSDGSTHDVTNNPALSWSSSNSTIATISSSQDSGNGLATGVSAGTITITASGLGMTGSASLEITTAVPVGLQVTPASSMTAVGLTQRFIAKAQMSDGSTYDVTNNPALSWISSDTDVATISSSQNSGNGVATGVNTGVVMITASGFGVTDSVSLDITTAIPLALQITPANSSVGVKLTQSFTATLLMSDRSTRNVTDNPALSWSSSNNTVATISSSQSSSNGVATGVSTGTVTISASGFGFTRTASLNVKSAFLVGLQVTPTSNAVAVGLTQSFTATAQMSDGSTYDVTNNPAVSWSSSDNAMATISSSQGTGNGLATGVNVGTVTIIASGFGLTDSASLEITPAIPISFQVTPANNTVAVGLTQSFIATAQMSDGSTRDVTNEPSVSWISSNSAVATISSNQSFGNGIATGVSLGTVTITASGFGVTGSASLESTPAIPIGLQVTPASSAVAVGLTQNFIATLQMSDGSTRNVTNDPSVSWSSSDSTVATISSSQSSGNGVATGVSVDIVTITASGFGFTRLVSLNVTSAVPIGLQVTPTNNAIAVGLTQSFITTALMSDGSTRDVTNDPEVSWISSNNAVVSITSNQSSGNGVATGVSVGLAGITATGFGITISTSLEITTAIPVGLQVTPASSAVAVGLTQSFIATVLMSDSSTRDVTNEPSLSWNTSNSSVATISSSQAVDNGVATGVSVGTATITASGFGFTRSVSLNVTSAVPLGLQVTPANSAIAVGLTQNFIATAQMSDGSTRNVTNDPLLSWSSNNIAIATISSSLASGNGVATGISVGTVTITASGFGTTGTASLEITPAVPVGLQITPVSSSIAAGLTQNFIATTQMSDGSTRTVTNDPAVNWSSSNTAVATISSNLGSGNGVAKGVSMGSVTITASGFGFTRSASLNITSAVPIGLQITPASSAVAAGLTQSFIATTQMSDGSTRDVTNDAALSWSSSNNFVATISSNQGSGNGIATGVSVGWVNITASGFGFTHSASLNVTSAVPVGLQVSPASSAVAVGLTQSFIATAQMSDSSTRDVTNEPSLSWSSSNTAVATISSSQGSGNGVATGVSIGTVTITASGLGFTHSASLNVTSTNSIYIAGVGTFSRPDGIARDWDSSASYCYFLDFLGSSEWFFPTKDELLALYNHRPNGSIQSQLGWPASTYWSSTRNPSNFHDHVYMLTGYVSFSSDGNLYDVSCIKR